MPNTTQGGSRSQAKAFVDIKVGGSSYQLGRKAGTNQQNIFNSHMSYQGSALAWENDFQSSTSLQFSVVHGICKLFLPACLHCCFLELKLGRRSLMPAPIPVSYPEHG